MDLSSSRKSASPWGAGAGDVVTFTFQVTVNEAVLIENIAVVSDGYGTGLNLVAWVNAERIYLPLVVRGHEGLVLSTSTALSVNSAEGLALKNRASALNKTAVVTETAIRYDYDFAGNNPINGIPR